MKGRGYEEGNMYLIPKEHFEMFETRIYLIYRKGQGSQTHVHVPVDIVRHLGLQNKDDIVIAIMKSHSEEETPKREGDTHADLPMV